MLFLGNFTITSISDDAVTIFNSVTREGGAFNKNDFINYMNAATEKFFNHNF